MLHRGFLAFAATAAGRPAAAAGQESLPPCGGLPHEEDQASPSKDQGISLLKWQPKT